MTFFRRHQTLIIAALVFISCLPYVFRLGFYNDDWALLSAYHNSSQNDLLSLMRADGEIMRPGRVLYDAFLYWSFRQWPLGYHLTNALVLSVTCGLFSLLLRRMGVSDTHAFALAITWATLPHAATGRFWFVIFQLPASIGLMFGAALCELESLRCPLRRWRWRAAAVFCLVGSALLYEVILPLSLLIPFIGARMVRAGRRSLRTSEKAWLLTYPVVVALLVLMKILTTSRLDAGTPANFPRWFVSNVYSALSIQSDPNAWGFNVWRALDIAFVDLGVRLPGHAMESATHLGATSELVVVASLAFATLAWLSRVAPSADVVRTRNGLAFIGIGCGLFVLGWTVFLGSASLQLSSTGIGNRTAGAASIGVAFVFVGLIECAASLLPQGQRRLAFATLSALTVASGLLVIFRLADDWGKAWAKEQEVLAHIGTQFPGGMSGRTLILDGVCQYVGPATVFEASWDLEWALQTKYSDPSIRADVVTPDIAIGQDDVRTDLYGEERVYKYGSVVVFRPSSGAVSVLENINDAERFFDRWDPDHSGGCAPGRIGQGASVFNPGGHIVYVGGFYNPERDQSGAEWRWMSAAGVVRLENTPRDMRLTIKGRVPPQATRATIRVTFNGHILDTIEGAETIEKQYNVAASEQTNGDASELRIGVDRTFVPGLVDPSSVDRRRLGFVLYDLKWERR